MAANTVKKTSVKKTESRKGSRQTASGGAKGKQRTKSVSSRTKQQTARTPVQTQTGENPMILREAALWLILAACVFIFISYFGVGGFVGSVISDVSFGVFGAAAYLFPFLIFIAAAFLISNKGSKTALIKFFSAVFLYLCVTSFAELILNGYQEEVVLSQIYTESATYRTGGGVTGGFVCSVVCPALGTAGTGVALAVLMIICLILITQKSLIGGLRRQSRRVYESAKDSGQRRRRQESGCTEDEAGAEFISGRVPREKILKEAAKAERRRSRISARGGKSLRNSGKNPRELDIPVDFPTPPVRSRHEHKVRGVTFDTKLEGRMEASPEVHEIGPDLSVLSDGPEPSAERMADEPETYVVNLDTDESEEEKRDAEPENSHEELPHLVQNLESFEIQGLEKEEDRPEPDAAPEPSAVEKVDTQKAVNGEPGNPPGENVSGKAESGSGRTRKNPKSTPGEIQEGIASVEKEMAQAVQAVKKEYVFPPLRLLKKGRGSGKGGQQQEIRKTAAKLQQTLDSFGVRAKVVNASCGPAVTRYELLPEQGVKVSKITNLSDDIKLNLAAADIRIEAPIPGKSVVGIEVPNRENSAVMLRDLLETDEFKNHPSSLAFATGKDIGGKVVVSDIAKMPHLLIAGATGSGKSVCINTLIMSILYKANPEDVKLIMIDPKVVELSVYNGIPHLYIPVVTDPKKAAGALNWGVAEMDERYRKFAELGVRDLKGYNKKIESIGDIEDENKPQKLPQIVIIVDELADLMMVAPGEVEDSICRLAQLARAAGIHLIIATQRPSVDVITGLIKANMPSRIAFAVSSGVDSRTIIDMNGAEKLLGKGDMLFYPQGYKKPVRVQGAFVSDEEVSDVVDFLINKNTDVSYKEKMEEQMAKVQQAVSTSKAAEDVDELFVDAGKFIIEKDKASIGMLQRVFKIGFNRAARIMDQLSEAGVVGPEEGTKPRKILMSMEQFENMLEQG